jgi:hypothetical protein
MVAAYRTNRIAGVISAAALLTCVAGIRMPVGVAGEVVFAILINSAWYVWFEFGRERKSWLFAWCLAYLLVGMALLTGGVKAFLYFYWPLLFMRRPMRIWLRLRQWDHWVGFLALCGFAALWTLMMPAGTGGLTAQFQALVPDEAVSGYLWRLLALPVVAAAAFFPWGFLVWPAFCSAFRQLEPRPVFCSYLRTICTSLFILVWLVPIGGYESLLPLLGPMAILVSRNYPIMVRRHGKQLQYLGRLLAVSAIGGAGAALFLVTVFWGGLGEALIGRGLPRPALLTMLIISVLGLTLAVGLYRSRAERPVWATVAFAMAALHFTLFAAIGVPTRSHFTVGHYRDIARELHAAVPETATIYWLPPNNKDPRLGWYLSRPVVAVAGELPPDQSSIYVLAGHRKPVAAQWQWHAASDPMALGRHRLRMWRGTVREVEPASAPQP